MADYQAWLARYGQDYATDVERRQAFADYQRNAQELAAIFGGLARGR